MRNVCMFSGRLCCLCNLLINHTQRCLPTLALHLSWRTAFLCVSAQARIDETSKQKEDMTRRTNKYNANGSKESMRRKSRSSAMRKLLVVVVLVRHAKKKKKTKQSAPNMRNSQRTTIHYYFYYCYYYCATSANN